MVGIGIAGCAPCNCEPEDCCFPSDSVSFTLISDSACPLNDEVVTINRTTYTDSGESTTYEPNGNAIWVGTYDTSAICADTDEIKVIMYCATISGVVNWVAELYCDGTRQATIATTDFTCTNGELTAVLFISPDLGALCCGCAGLPCGAGGSVGTVTLPAECDEGVSSGCCTDVPTTLYATFTDVSGCTDIVGETITITWNGSTRWYGEKTIGGKTWATGMYCDEGSPPNYVIPTSLGTDCEAASPGTLGADSYTCSPFEATFISLVPNDSACCDGAGLFKIVITE